MSAIRPKQSSGAGSGRFGMLDYIIITASSIMTSNLSPVTFYNFAEYKYEPLDRLKYLKIKTNPNSYPANTIIIPPMELE